VIYDIISFIESLYGEISKGTSAVFALSWTIGWLLRGSPIPIFRIKRGRQDRLEDTIVAKFFIAIGTTIFTFVQYLASQI